MYWLTAGSPLSHVPLLQIDDLSKSYGGVRALEKVSFEIAPGEIHAVCGENGAGKSTLIKILAGVITPDAGEIRVHGESLTPGSVHQSELAGIAVMYQESTAFPNLDAVDNIFAGRELTCCHGLLLDRREMRRRAAAVFDRLGEQIRLDVPLSEMSLAQRQVVAMARALSRNCRLLIMDEPTAALSQRETQRLLAVLRQLRSDGVSVLYVSHRLEEIFEIADRVTVLRDGRHVSTRRTQELNRDQLIQLMVGREMDELYRRRVSSRQIGDVVLAVDELTRRGVFEGITFSVRAGEILGIAGLVGAGRSEVARAIFGVDDYDAGTVRIAGRTLAGGSIQSAMAAGIVLVPEDRQHEGLVLPMAVRHNLSMAMLKSLQRGGMIRRREESTLVERQMHELDIRAAGSHVAAETLSGGNQQKVVLGKWLACRPKVLILDEPTRGIDVGAKAQVHHLIRQLAEQGLATVLISSELPELLSISDRVLVMRNGKRAGLLEGTAATQEQILQLALPDTQSSAVA